MYLVSGGEHKLNRLKKSHQRAIQSRPAMKDEARPLSAHSLRLISGWAEGLQLMPEGAKCECYIRRLCLRRIEVGS
ncbi:MAG: hypothetical protein ACI9HY_003898 [Planctomycetaceae bacterium]|jgi:hypothetical protein